MISLKIHRRPFNSGGNGGQHSNKTLNAMEVWVVLPDGRKISAQATESKCQHRNRKAAESVLLSRVKAALTPERQRPDVSGRVRTYHLPDNRVVDHASGSKRSYRDVFSDHQGKAFAELVDARRRVLAERAALEALL